MPPMPFRAFSLDDFRETASWARLAGLLSGNGGCFGLAGPPGAGKTWLIERAIGEAERRKGMGLMFPCPGAYQASEFVPALSETLAAAYLGHLLVEPRRHAPGLADLTDAEARSMGWWCSRASRALRDVARAEHVYAAVIGDGVPHLHIHLLPRFAGTPREYWGIDVDEWPRARRGTAAEIGTLVHDLRGYLAGHQVG